MDNVTLDDILKMSTEEYAQYYKQRLQQPDTEEDDIEYPED